MESDLHGRTRRVHGALSILPVVDPSATKSAYSGSESTVSDWTLLQFEEGILGAVYYQSTGADIRNVDVVAGRRYDWYALANVGDVRSDFSVGTTTKTDIASYRVRGVRMTAVQALPMAWFSERDHPSGVGFTAQEIREGATLGVNLERIVSKYDITMDPSGLAAWSFNASSLVIRGPEDVLAFTSNMAAASDQEVTDCATATDLAALNGGQAVTFYPCENKNGILLPGNRDPWAKKPSSFATEHASARPTYVEITGTATLRDGSAKSVPLTYRFYLGRDNCSDFDVVRNTANTVTLVLSDQAIWDAIDEGDSPAEPIWKVEAGSFADDRGIAWSDASLQVHTSEVAAAGVLLSPSGMSYTLWLDQNLLDAGLRVYTDAGLTDDVTPSSYDAGVQIDGNAALYFYTTSTARASGTATVRTLDGRKRGDLAVSVSMLNYPVGLTITGNQYMRYDGELRLTVLASMADGTTVDVTNDLNTSWTVPDQAAVFQTVGADVRFASPGVVVTTLESEDFNVGTRTRALDFSFSVGASYSLNGTTATARLNNRYAIKELDAIYYTPDQISFSEGGQANNPESVGERGWMSYDVTLWARFHDGSLQDLGVYPWYHENRIEAHGASYVKISTYDRYEAPFFYREFGSDYLVYEAYVDGQGGYYVPTGSFYAESERVDGSFTSTIDGNTYNYYEGKALPCRIARASFGWPSVAEQSNMAFKYADLNGTDDILTPISVRIEPATNVSNTDDPAVLYEAYVTYSNGMERLTFDSGEGARFAWTVDGASVQPRYPISGDAYTGYDGYGPSVTPGSVATTHVIGLTFSQRSITLTASAEMYVQDRGDVVSLTLTPAEQTVSGLEQSEITATATFANGSTRVVNANAEWTLSNPVWQGTKGSYHYPYQSNSNLTVTATFTWRGVTVTSNPVVVHHVYAEPNHGSIDHHEVEWRPRGSSGSYTTDPGTLQVGDQVEIRHILVYQDGYRSETYGIYAHQIRYDVGSAAVLSFSSGYSAEALLPGSVTVHYANDDESWIATNALSWTVVDAPPVYEYTFVRLWLDPGNATLAYGAGVTESLKVDYRWRLNGGVWNDETMSMDAGYDWSMTGDTGFATRNGRTVTNANDSESAKSVTLTATVTTTQTVTQANGSFTIPVGASASALLTLEQRGSTPDIYEYEYVRLWLDPGEDTLGFGTSVTEVLKVDYRWRLNGGSWNDETMAVNDGYGWSLTGDTDYATQSGGSVTNANDSGSAKSVTLTATVSPMQTVTLANGSFTIPDGASARAILTSEPQGTPPDVYEYAFVRLWLDPGDATLEEGANVTEVLKMDYRWRLNDGPWHDESMAVNDGYGWSLSGDTDYATQSGGTVTNANDSGSAKSVTLTATVSATLNVALDHGSLEIPAGTQANAVLTLNSQPIIVYEYRVVIDPASATISAGGTTAFTATLQRRQAGSSDDWSDLTSSAGDFAWTSSHPDAATVSGGLANGCNDGISEATTDISAEYCGSAYPDGQGQSATAHLSVSGKVFQSIYVPDAQARPFAPVNAVAYGDQIRFSCYARYDYGSDADVTDVAGWGFGSYLGHEGSAYTGISNNQPTSGTATSFSVSYGGQRVTVDVTVYPKYVTALTVEFRDSFRVSENSKPRGGLTWNDGSTSTETSGGLDGYTVTDADDPSRVWTYEPGDDVDMSELGAGTYVLTIRHTSSRYGSDHTLIASKTFTVGNY